MKEPSDLKIEQWYSKQDDVKRVLKINNQMASVFTSNFIAENPRYKMPPEELQKLEWNETRLLPDSASSFALSKKDARAPAREKSAREFAKEPIPFEQVEAILRQSFRQESVRGESFRQYPSAGALYPVEVVVAIAPGLVKGGPAAGVYHYLPVSHALEPLREYSEVSEYEGLISKTMLKGTPHFAVVYFVNITRAIDKYGPRGFRHALMEAGAMYQLASEQAMDAGLGTCVWSLFSDLKVTSHCRLNQTLFVPAITQLFGKQAGA